MHFVVVLVMEALALCSLTLMVDHISKLVNERKWRFARILFVELRCCRNMLRILHHFTATVGVVHILCLQFMAIVVRYLLTCCFPAHC